MTFPFVLPSFHSCCLYLLPLPLSISPSLLSLYPPPLSHSFPLFLYLPLFLPHSFPLSLFPCVCVCVCVSSFTLVWVQLGSLIPSDGSVKGFLMFKLCFS